MTTAVDELVTMAELAGATIVRSPSATIIVIATAKSDDAERLSLDEARVLAKLRSTRPLREAAHAGELTLYGRQRSRTVKRADLDKWIESRRVAPVAGPSDDDLDRRMARLARQKRK